MRLILADDHDLVRDAIAAILQNSGCSEVRTAASFPDAAQIAAQEGPFDLAILDYDMPGMNGADLMHAVRADEKLKELPAILMLAVGAGKQDVLNAVALGISGFIIKPFRPEQLRAQITKVMGW